MIYAIQMENIFPFLPIYYKLNDLETYLVQKIMRNNNSINVINSISNELEVDTCEAEEFVSIFLNNYDSIFEYKKQNKAMNISGEIRTIIFPHQ